MSNCGGAVLLLGLFEAGHWPCALKTTQHILSRKDRTMGNSILQSGATIGAMLTPFVVEAIYRTEPDTWWYDVQARFTDLPGNWPFAFQLIGVVGMLWVFLWLRAVRTGDLPSPVLLRMRKTEKHPGSITDEPRGMTTAEKPLFLEGPRACCHGGKPSTSVGISSVLGCQNSYKTVAAIAIVTNNFNSAYNIVTDVGCISAGAVTLWLARLSECSSPGTVPRCTSAVPYCTTLRRGRCHP